MKTISIKTEFGSVVAKCNKRRMSKINKDIPEYLNQSVRSFVSIKKESLNENLVLSLKESKGDLKLTLRNQGFLNWAKTLFNKDSHFELIQNKEFEHGLGGLFLSATEKLYSFHRFKIK